MKVSKMVMVFAMMTVFASANAAKVFDANGNLLKDTDSVNTAMNPTSWSEQTKKNIAVVQSLAKQTPHYNEGYYAWVEEQKQAKAEQEKRAKEREEKNQKIFDNVMKYRQTRAMERHADAAIMDAMMPDIIILK